MKSKRNTFDDLLSVLHVNNVLPYITLIGSWCLPIYREYFNNTPEVPILRTMDLDILVQKHAILPHPIDVPEILKSFGFEEEFSHLSGFSKYVHPEIEVEFMVAEHGRGKTGPYNIKHLNVLAQGLRFMDIVIEHTITVIYNSIPVRVPEPAAFVLLKYLISTKRQDPAKKNKDLHTADALGQFMLKDPEQRNKIKVVFSSMHKKWQHTLLHVIEEHSSLLYNFIRKQ